MKVLALLLCGSVLASSSGCSFLADPMQTVAVVTHPDAEVLVDGAVVAKGSCNVKMDRNQAHTIMARRGERFVVATVLGGQRYSTAGWLDLVGTFLFILPAFGFLSSGAYKLDRDSVNLEGVGP